MPKRSAGILLFRRSLAGVEVFLVHPGGPFWAHRDLASWSCPKGEYGEEEGPLTAARREFAEETGMAAEGVLLPLGTVKLAGGKLVTAWALEGDFDPCRLRSNTFTREWPPHSGRVEEYPEADRGAWFSLDAARRKILPGLIPLLDRLQGVLSGADEPPLKEEAK